jgi:hypothetical protein
LENSNIALLNAKTVGLSERTGKIVVWGEDLEKIYLDGTYLFFFSDFIEDSDFRKPPVELDLIRDCISICRLIFGVSSLTPIHPQVVLKKEHANLQYIVGFPRTATPHGDGTSLMNTSLLMREDDFQIVNAYDYHGQNRPLGLKLVERAQNSPSKELQFLFLWIALEVFAGATGKERERFFLEQLQSTLINDVARKIFDKRVSLIHFGYSDPITQGDLETLWGIIRIVALYPSNLSKKILSHFQEVV